MKLFKNIMLAFVVMASAFSVSAQVTFLKSASVANLTAGATTVVDAPVTLKSLSMYSTNATPTICYLYDSATTITNATYTNNVRTVTTEVVEQVTSTGVTNTYTNTVIKFTPTAVTGSTAARTPLYSFVVPGAANGVVTLDNLNIVFTRSLVLSNSLTGVSGIVLYSSHTQ